MKSKSVTLHNVILPIWLAVLSPVLALVSLMLSFGMDSLVLCLSGLKLGTSPRGLWKSAILRVWPLGFAADAIGALWLLLPILINELLPQSALGWWGDNVISGVMTNPFSSVFALLWTLIGVVISGFFVYLFALKCSLDRTGLDEASKKKAALWLGIFTAPWLFLLPTAWFI